MTEFASERAPADAIGGSWVGRTPPGVQPWLRLMRLDRPIGIWLLFWPCVFGIALGGASASLDILEDLWLILLCAVGAVVMRGAGCTFNDIIDRDIDARVARTSARPIPSGAVTVQQAWVFLAAQCLAGLIILLQFHWFAILLGAASLLLVAAYPFMKRITWWPQAWLGLTFNWGALLGFAARAHTISLSSVLLYAGCIFWTMGYDTIYAHQDKEDDALIGVRSTALLLGAESRGWIAFFYLATVGLFLLAGGGGLDAPVFSLALVAAAVHLGWQVWRLNIDDPANCLMIFRSNRDVGAILALAFLLDDWLH